MIVFKIRNCFFIFYFFLGAISCQKNNSAINVNERLLSSLDKKIKQKQYYENKKKITIQKLKDKLKTNKNSDSVTYDVNYQIAEEYLGYQCDSAYLYSDRNRQIALKNNNNRWLHKNLLQRSVLLSTTGLFVESKEILDRINPEKLSSDLRFSYNSAYECLYSNLLDYTGDNNTHGIRYKKNLVNYYDYAYKSLKPDNQFYYLFLSHKNRINNQWKLANDNIDRFLKTTNPGTRLYAIGSYCKAVIEAKLGNQDSQESCLIYSAISDIESSTKENRSMQDLASILYKKGETERAYIYIQSALQDANFYNARFRSIQISKVQPIIENTYLLTINSQNNKLRWSVFIISILLLGLAITLFFIYKQLKTIASSRNELSLMNTDLKMMNGKLNEANHIKEEYVAFFINQCSIYLERFEKYKKLISKRLSAGQVDKLTEMINNKKNVELDLDELYLSFDKAFLRIYPNFVEEVNKLLKPEERYDVTNILKTELRIFALIRLGIDDAQQISDFLRYSLRTIYNYKSKLKTKSVVGNDEFEEKIMMIGSISYH
ncbi:DUF6377 domain-containing protein [Epilithonimonas hispanica]|uniref:DUF6377 domain-containing protein n=1 Tax=Epilithonimonas hispanica TaxID=358687 RepID=A0A3D9CPX5_9FLAO|nr:DUF6377 domain-containing protein [Epilithonimonas hispanica]REC67810.1 hypothetical protein DRF58_14665 [Epilithonimonas hispanica]